jgi:hypothetical protein
MNKKQLIIKVLFVISIISGILAFSSFVIFKKTYNKVAYFTIFGLVDVFILIIFKGANVI